VRIHVLGIGLDGYLSPLVRAAWRDLVAHRFARHRHRSERTRRRRQDGLATAIAVVHEAFTAAVGRHTRGHACSILLSQPLARCAWHVGWKACWDAASVVALPLTGEAAVRDRLDRRCRLVTAATERTRDEDDDGRAAHYRHHTPTQPASSAR
jgi:hypothetical protein